MGTAAVSTNKKEAIKCPFVTVLNKDGIVVMRDVILRGECSDGSPLIQKQGQQPGKPTMEALIIEKAGGWTVTKVSNKIKGKK